MLYLALSCLQGREMRSAASELLSLGVKGLQLTPGNVPDNNFSVWLSEQNVFLRTHHGFHYQALKQKVWNSKAECLVNADSVHPPQSSCESADLWFHKASQGAYKGILLETMYPSYCLGSGDELLWAMSVGLSLAVDVSHIYIQLCQGSLDTSVWKKLQNYSQIGELHLSSNQGSADIHQPITQKTFGFDWVLERGSDGIPVILECYLHRLSTSERLEQINLVKENLL